MVNKAEELERQCEQMYEGAGDLHGRASWRCLNSAIIFQNDKWYCSVCADKKEDKKEDKNG